MLAIIGGTGLTQLANLELTRRQLVRTPYGEASGPITFGKLNGRDVMFLARHGYGHTIPPHAVNYQANIWALKSEGASKVVSVASVGGIRADLVPGTLAVPRQLLDYTYDRKHTYFDGPDEPVTHVDFTHPYCEILRGRLIDVAGRIGQPIVDGGVYAATQGPRLESAAEIDRLERDGADMVGMTGMPEAALAREVSLEYATIAVVANYAAGRGDSRRAVPLDRIGEILDEAMGRVRRIIERLCEK